VFVYVGVQFQENPPSERTCNIGPNRLYEFCYFLSFDSWTSYLARILFLQGCGSLFWEFSNSTRIFNELQYNLQVWQVFINVSIRVNRGCTNFCYLLPLDLWTSYLARILFLKGCGSLFGNILIL
jgi:hypothetical protein